MYRYRRCLTSYTPYYPLADIKDTIQLFAKHASKTVDYLGTTIRGMSFATELSSVRNTVVNGVEALAGTVADIDVPDVVGDIMDVASKFGLSRMVTRARCYC